MSAQWTVLQPISCVAAPEWLAVMTSGRAASRVHQDCILLVTLQTDVTFPFADQSHGWKCDMYREKYILSKALSAHIHISITLLIELTLRGHFSISGCWMDTFQPRVVVHLCYAVVWIQQQRCRRLLMLIISFYSTDELELRPNTDLLYSSFTPTVVIRDNKTVSTISTKT